MSVTDVLSSIWDDVIGTQPLPDREATLLFATLALVVVVVPRTWRVARHVVTVAHEGAHGVAALLAGRRLAGIRLHSDTSGVTVSRGRPTGLGVVVTMFAGYVGPALLGLGGAALLRAGHALAVLWLAVLLLGLLLLQIRNFHGLYVVLVAGLGVFAVSWWGSAAVQTAVAWTGTWFLLLAAPRPVLELQSLRRHGRARTSDADQLARLTRFPGLFWVGAFLAVTVGCLVLGTRWLLGAAT